MAKRSKRPGSKVACRAPSDGFKVRTFSPIFLRQEIQVVLFVTDGAVAIGAELHLG